jgi:hypothetical protein
MEREIGLDQDNSKPLLLKLIEKIKFGGTASNSTSPIPGYSPPD